jgi:hypothetical protein
LDVRFDFDSDKKDRFGEHQLKWVDDKFAEHFDSDVTLIGSGVQILPDRWFFSECFEWPSKKSLLEVINKH